jgi:hypothetical protein
MKPTALLKKQHRKVEGMFAALEKEKGDASAVLAQLANDLAAHLAIEQTLFYPAVREIDPENGSDAPIRRTKRARSVRSGRAAP